MTAPVFEDELNRAAQEQGDDHFGVKLSREGQLLLSAGAGVFEAGKQTILHPGERLPQAGIGLVAGTALGLLTRGRFGVGAAVTTALTAAFCKQAFHDGGNLLGAAADAWQTPENMQANKKAVALSVGNFAMDSLAFGLGGAAGARLSRIPLGLTQPKFVAESVGISNPNGMHISAEANWKATHSMLESLKAGAGEPMLVSGKFGKPAALVPQKVARTAALNEALGTTDIGTCSALVVVDRAAGKQLLAHGDHLTNPAMLREPLSKLNLRSSNIYILEGEGNAFSPNIGVLGSAERILLALGNDPQVLKNVRFLRYGGPNGLANLVVHRGKFYADAVDYK